MRFALRTVGSDVVRAGALRRPGVDTRYGARNAARSARYDWDDARLARLQRN